ncbi:hypothetical protein [Xanthobacter autotrophicus]|uniref:hypothetical protein n=1 Tax=Xanthobacter autotrophicus TaxID=280 RepID=UPI00372B3200
MNRIAGRARDYDWSYIFVVIVFMSFAIRDAFTGSARFFLSSMNVYFIWFVPDILAFSVMGMFVYQQFVVRKNAAGMFFFGATLFSYMVSIYFYQQNFLTFVSGMKMFAPLYVGFCFYDRSVVEMRWVRIVLFILLVIVTVGVLVNPYYEYPWTGETVTAFGVEKAAVNVWWDGSGETRYGGITGDSTMAGFMICFTYMLIAPYIMLLVNIALWPIIIWALVLTTSKTALGIFCIYGAMFLVSRLLGSRERVMLFLRRAALLSFLCLLVPVVLMIALGGTDLGGYSVQLLSIADRINNTWQLPFKYVAELFPLGLVLGCGIGCFAYPMDYTAMVKYSVPLDNFYLTTYINMGIPFLVYIAMQIRSVRYCLDPIKLSLMTIFNIYAITVQCYGPSFATLVAGYIFSDVFAGHAKAKEKRPIRVGSRHEGAPTSVPAVG